MAKALVAAQRLQYPVLLTRRAGAMGKVPWQGDTCGTIPRIESRGIYIYIIYIIYNIYIYIVYNTIYLYGIVNS